MEVQSALRDKTDYLDRWNAVEAPIRRALIARYGHERGTEAFADARAYYWEHRERMANHPNLAGYLFRVGQSAARRRRLRAALIDRPADGVQDRPLDHRLAGALRGLSARQRVCVVLVFAYDMERAEVAQILGCDRSTVDTHVQRGLRRLRQALGEKTGR